MTAPPDPRNAPAPSENAEGEAKSLDGDKVKDTDVVKHTYPNRNAPVDYGDVLDCAMACNGRRDCPWCPYTCRLIDGGGR